MRSTKKPFRHSSPELCHAPKGSVLILVVAVLALLVLMGTAYLVTARTDRSNASAMSAANNVDLARDAVMATVTQTIGSSMLDSAGKAGGYDSTTGTYGTLAARNYDFPETGTITFGQTNANPKMRDEPWLVSKLHNPASGTDISQLTARLFDPATGIYDIVPSATSTINVVNDQSTVTDAEDPVTTTYDSMINLLPFSDASGIRYRFGVRILDTSRMANLNMGSTSDSGSVADINGNYITSIRLAPDTATAYPATNTSPPGPYPASTNTNYFNGSASASTNDGPNTANLHYTTGNLGRVQTGSTYATFTGLASVQQWQSQMFQIENLPATGGFSLFDLSDELELRSYGQFGTAYTPRPAMNNGSATNTIWPYTLSNHVPPASAAITGNPRRRNYTANSFSRELRTQPDPDTTLQFTCTPVSGTVTPTLPGGKSNTWPSAPAKVSFNQDLGIANPASAMGLLASSAMNLATAMRAAGPLLTNSANFPGYSNDEIAAFIANYITGRWNGFKVDPAVSTATAYYLPAGPSFVDGTGFCIRTADISGNPITGDFTIAGTPTPLATGKIVLGYAAQPFISRVDAAFSWDGSTPTLVDFAVELYNPYGVNLSVAGWQLKFKGGYTKTLDGYVPAGGYYVVTMASNFSVDASAQSMTPDGSFNPQTSPSVALYRPYCPRGQTSIPAPPTAVAAVDQAPIAALTTPDPALFTNTTPPATVLFTWTRSNGLWGAAVNQFPPAGPVIFNYNIGAAGSSGFPGFVLYDRLTVTPTYSGVANAQAQGAPFTNIADFEKLMRITNEVDTTGEPLSPSLLITDQTSNAKNNQSGNPWNATDLWGEAILHFDFKAVPQLYQNSPPNDSAAFSGSPTPKPGDTRAVRFLDQITFLDRAYDPTAGTTDLAKIRLPGQINVNTASGDVLRAIPNMSDQMVANILAYRQRAANASVTYNAVSNNQNYSIDPGFGIRSLSELMIPINDTLTQQPSATATTTNMTIPDRDRLWASIYNLCTVRSDTFAVYGYLEAVKANPTDAAFNNNADWYVTGTTNISDDPHPAATVPLIRLSRRRWVAIVDRSFCNYDRTSPNFAIPRVVAIKDLPQ